MIRLLIPMLFFLAGLVTAFVMIQAAYVPKSDYTVCVEAALCGDCAGFGGPQCHDRVPVQK